MIQRTNKEHISNAKDEGRQCGEKLKVVLDNDYMQSKMSFATILVRKGHDHSQIFHASAQTVLQECAGIASRTNERMVHQMTSGLNLVSRRCSKLLVLGLGLESAK